MMVKVEVDIPEGPYCYFDNPDTSSCKCQFFNRNDGWGIRDWCELYHEPIHRVDSRFPSIKFQECVVSSGTQMDKATVESYGRQREDEERCRQECLTQRVLAKRGTQVQ